MTPAEVKKATEQKMQKSIETLKMDLAKVRTGRAHVGILDHVMVDYYGTPTQITQVANLTLLDARTIGVQPWEKKMMAVIEKAIRESDLGLNPATVGDLIRPLPADKRSAIRPVLFLVVKCASCVVLCGIWIIGVCHKRKIIYLQNYSVSFLSFLFCLI